MVEAQQVDREAAAAVYRSEGNDYSASVIADGGGDDWPIVQAFASHRQAGVQQGLDMAAAYIQAEYPFDKRKLVPAIRKLGGDDA